MGWVPPPAPPLDAPKEVREAHRQALVRALSPRSRRKLQRRALARG
ncbi:MAG: hypothetical protein QOG43_2908 [Actinomycetota bacterium]|jgi:hypothetical protein|nr:hypothetical protein [Actinomycetota bacterium]